MNRELLELSRMRGMARAGLIRAVRVNAGLSLREVARVVGVHPTTIHYWETGRNTPRGEAAIRYARLLLELEIMARR